MSNPRIEDKMRLGLKVFGALVAIEVTEYIVGVSVKRGNWPFLAFWALIGAGPIVYYFMHIMQLRHPEE